MKFSFLHNTCIIIMFYYYYTRIPQRVVTLDVQNLYVQLELVQLQKQGHIFYIRNHRLDQMMARKGWNQNNQTFLPYTLRLLYTNARRLLENMASTRAEERQHQNGNISYDEKKKIKELLKKPWNT
jgi:hypothetical protein